MTQIEKNVRDMLARMTPLQKFRLALEILQEQEPLEEVTIPEKIIAQSTERLARYYKDPQSGIDAFEAIEEIRKKYTSS